MEQKSRIHVIMNVSHGCNLACDYCYYSAEMTGKPGSMSLPTVERIFEQVANSSALSVDFSIHGGEPLLRNSAYYTEFFHLQQKYLASKQVSNSIQTNGTLIDDDFAHNYLEIIGAGHNLGLGISLDGPQEIHDAFRVHRKGRRGSFREVMRGIELLEKYGISVALLAVAPLPMSDRASVLYSFFKSIPNIHFLDLLVPHYTSFPSAPPASLSEIFTTVFDEWFFDREATFNLRFFSSVIVALLSGRGSICTFQHDCITNNKMLSIRPDGDISFCDSFPDVRLGNIWTDSIDLMVNKNNLVRRSLSVQEEERLEQCLFCEWYRLCNGGCPSNYIRGSGKPHHFCAEYQKIFSHIKATLVSHCILGKGFREHTLDGIVNPRLKETLHTHIMAAQASSQP